MLNHRTVILGLVLLTVLSLSRDARASCAEAEGCVCTFQSGLIATFTGTIIEGSGKAFSDGSSLKVRIDEVTLADGSSSQLEAGTVTDAKVQTLEVDVKQGDRVLGFSTITCDKPNDGCNFQLSRVEILGLRAVFDATSLVPCGTFVPFSSVEARELLLDPNCEGRLRDRLGLDEPTCHDGGFFSCSAPGKRTSDGAAGALGFLALLGAYRLRRGRR